MTMHATADDGLRISRTCAAHDSILERESSATIFICHVDQNAAASCM